MLKWRWSDDGGRQLAQMVQDSKRVAGRRKAAGEAHTRGNRRHTITSIRANISTRWSWGQCHSVAEDEQKAENE